MMPDAIKNFPAQFAFDPDIQGTKKLKHYPRYVLTGMGGSRLAALLAQIDRPDLPLTIWNDYGLPPIPAKERRTTCVIVSSYSGNTEEALDGLAQALKMKMPTVAIAVGGALIEEAKKKRVPFIQLPDTGIQPRAALGFSLRALLTILRDSKGLEESKRLARVLKPDSIEPAGRALARKLKDKVPVIYASCANLGIAYNWKIKLNETGKIPAFYNILPELNHNEMNGFDAAPASKHLSDRFFFLFLRDLEDHPRITKRMNILEKLYRDRHFPIETMTLTGRTAYEKIFMSLLLADWTAVHTAELYGLESEQVPMVEEFKKLMAE